MLRLQTVGTLISLAAAISATSCDRPTCKNTNFILERFKFDSKEYKDELEKQIDRIGTEHLNYWFEEYIKKNDKEFIVVNIQGAELCAKGELLVKNWEKLAGIRQNSGAGYHGAQLKGLTLQIVQDAEGKEFVFTGVDKIID